MINLEIFRLEVNYLLTILENKIGEEEKDLTEVGLDILVNCYLFGSNQEFAEDYFKRINDNLNRLSSIEDFECSRLYFNIPNIIKFLDTLKSELK